MNAVLSARKALLIGTTLLLGFTFTSWKQRTTNADHITQDTTPPKNNKKIMDIDEAMKELDNAKIDVEKSIRDIDWDKVNADMKTAMQKMDVDMQKMHEDLKKSLNEIDVEKMKQDVNDAVARIDWDEIKRNIDKAKEVDLDKVKEEVETARAAIEKQKPEIEKSMREARESIAKAKVEMQEHKDFINSLEQDGLINKKDGYTIAIKEGKLIINGKEQPGSVYNKYRTYLEKHQNITIKKDENGFDIRNDKEE